MDDSNPALTLWLYPTANGDKDIPKILFTRGGPHPLFRGPPTSLRAGVQTERTTTRPLLCLRPSRRIESLTPSSPRTPREVKKGPLSLPSRGPTVRPRRPQHLSRFSPERKGIPSGKGGLWVDPPSRSGLQSAGTSSTRDAPLTLRSRRTDLSVGRTTRGLSGEPRVWSSKERSFRKIQEVAETLSRGTVPNVSNPPGWVKRSE